MAKKLFFVVLLLALAITSVDLVVNVSATGELLETMGDARGESPMDQTAEQPTESWADWAKDKFSGFGGSGSDSQDGAQAPSPVAA